MASLISFPIVIYGNKLVSNMPLLIGGATSSRNIRVHEKNQYKTTTFSNQTLIGRRKRGLSLVPFNAESKEAEEEHNPALETVLKLYSAIKNQNINEVSNIIGDECRCVCNFFSFFQFFQGKQQVLEFFKYVMKTLGKNIEFVVQPTLQDGMNVGVSWKLQWSKTHMPLGKGFSFYICHIYEGKVLIRNVEMFMEPLLHVEPLRLKIMGHFMGTFEKIWSKKCVTECILALIFMTIILLFTKPGLY